MRHSPSRLLQIGLPLGFGLLVLLLWQLAVQGFDIPPAILPAPTAIAARFADLATGRLGSQNFYLI